MWGGIVGLIIQLVSGAVGGNIAGAALKQYDLGSVGNSIVGVIGGGLAAKAARNKRLRTPVPAWSRSAHDSLQRRPPGRRSRTVRGRPRRCRRRWR